MQWLQLVYKLPSQPSRKRLYIWRQLRGLGAIYLQDACCVLPRTPETERQLSEVAAKVRDFEGEATLSALAPAEPGWEERMIALVNRARDEEYQELLDTIERFEEELARETRKGKFTFAALEEVEDEHERLGRWFGRVRTRDLFQAKLQPAVASALERAHACLERFTARVYESSDSASGSNKASE